VRTLLQKFNLHIDTHQSIAEVFNLQLELNNQFDMNLILLLLLDNELARQQPVDSDDKTSGACHQQQLVCSEIHSNF
jgi:hypothetical protein